MDDVTWGALTLTLTLLAGIYTWFAFRRRGFVAGLRGVAITLLPLSAYLTRTLRMFTRIVDAVVDWATSLVLNPLVWVGTVLFGVSVALFVVAAVLSARGVGAKPGRRGVRRPEQAASLPPASSRKGAPAIDDDLADIEALLRKRGIS